MTADDKCGMGAGLLALGLAAGFIFLCQLPADVLTFLPHREMSNPEAVFDAVLFLLAVPAGAFFFWKGASAEPEEGPRDTTS